MVAREPGAPEPSTVELLRDLSEDTRRLVRDELAMARIEMQQHTKRIGIGAGLFGGAGVLALMGLGALVATAILALALVLDAWLAALVVTVALFAAAGLVALTGKKQVTEGTPPVPEQTIASVKEDVDTVKEARHGVA